MSPLIVGLGGWDLCGAWLRLAVVNSVLSSSLAASISCLAILSSGFSILVLLRVNFPVTFLHRLEQPLGIGDIVLAQRHRQAHRLCRIWLPGLERPAQPG